MKPAGMFKISLLIPILLVLLIFWTHPDATAAYLWYGSIQKKNYIDLI